mmetsp:Transcript_11859/g.28159  ORF Transcript_11859/g.28159 Transcript_11859/m.28159 type:complete len:269 (-) Transcript_11859:989-1795(-)
MAELPGYSRPKQEAMKGHTTSTVMQQADSKTGSSDSPTTRVACMCDSAEHTAWSAPCSDCATCVRSASGVQCRSSLNACSSPLTNAASGRCSMSTCGGLRSSDGSLSPSLGTAPLRSLPALLPLELVRLMLEGTEGMAIHLCFSRAAWKQSRAFPSDIVNKLATQDSKMGGSNGRKSSPTRPSDIPQYMLCSSTELRLLPSLILGRCALSASRYWVTRWWAQLERMMASAATCASGFAVVSSEKMALCCMTMSKRCRRWMSVNFLRKS